MHATNAATRKALVQRINKKLTAQRQFLVAKYKAKRLVGYCLVNGEPSIARYDVVEEPVDLVDMASRVGIPLTTEEKAAA